MIRQKRSRTFRLTLLLILALAFLVWWQRYRWTSAIGPGGEMGDGGAPILGPGVRGAQLYFANQTLDQLTLVQRPLKWSGNLATDIATLLQALTVGEGEATVLVAAEPLVTRVFLASDGTLYLDLPRAAWDGLKPTPAAELWLLRSLFKTLQANFSGFNGSGITGLKFLLDGQEAMTLGGTIALRTPFRLKDSAH